ncbi:MAG: S41 family peptidase, partial [Xanthomonadales bacterium]|nr:S41 family peptidase [Xanthomonadales bacterium]
MKKITFNAEENFEELWKTFFDRYPFFKLRNVDWKRQYDTFRPKVSRNTSEDELFDILCDMLAPLNDGHVELMASTCGDERKRYFNPEPKPGFWQEFTKKEIKSLFKVTKNTLFSNGFEKPKKSASWILRYCKSSHFGYLRILELEGEKKQKLTTALDQILSDFKGLDGVIIDIRNNPGGDD